MSKFKTVIIMLIIITTALILYKQFPSKKLMHGATSLLQTNKDFDIKKNGAWQGLSSDEHHYFDQGLAVDLAEFFKQNNAASIVDLGAGKGDYAKYFIAEDIFTSCYDGNLNTPQLSDGVCGIMDLTKNINLAKYDWVLSLEVGEHLPKEYEDIFIANLDRLNKKGIVLSWAIEGQGGDGHINERNNDYIKEKLRLLGYKNDLVAENFLRAKRTNWFKNTIMVFRKLN